MKIYPILQKTLFILVFSVISACYFFGLDNQSMHEDEYVWVYRGGRHFQALFLDHDFSDEIWQHYYSYDQPKLAEFAFGAFTWLVYQKKPSQVFTESGFNSQGIEEMEARSSEVWWVKNQAQDAQKKAIPEEWQKAYQLIVVNRYLSVFFGLGTLLFVFLIGRKIGNFWVGLLSMILLAQHSLFYLLSRRAMADSLLVFLMIGGLYWLFRFLADPKKKKHQILPELKVINLGLWAGLAASVKLNGFMILALVSLVIFLKTLKEISKKNYFQKIGRLLKQLGVISIITIGVFISLNPFVWKNPPENIKKMFLSRKEITQEMQKEYSSSSYKTFLSRLQSILGETLLPKIGAHQRMLSWLPQRTDLMLFIIGILFLIFEVLVKGHNWQAGVFLIFMIGTLFFMGEYLAVGHDRYFLPIIPYIVIVEAFGLIRIMGTVITAVKIVRE